MLAPIEEFEMPKFLIEVPHDAEGVACARAVQVFLTTGSHFLTHAEWGCRDGVHVAWMMVDLDSKAEALAILPPAFRSQARVVGLNQFTMTDIEPILRTHTSPGGLRSPKDQ
jgi:hypothetical protein